uniref:Chaperone protein DnaJ 11, chloroplastic-like n=1 Tax=Tanacetum cinerariifolium TaxID=118510 RepID=A0A699HQK5_TANCI|nr:chaperone protein DnaJ 11, chloroplastic-like [Tanacetum cinerariifolium]
MYSSVSTSNHLRLRPPPPSLHSTTTTLPSPTSPNLRSPRGTSPLSATAYATAEATCLAPIPTSIISSPPSLYDILGISSEASGGEIKTAYRKMARTSHPDVKDSSGEEFIRIHDAYSTLSDPDKRADYDRRLMRMRRSRSFTSARPVVSSFNGYTGRNWETDQCW